jgi:hypothetical protein
MSVQSLRYLKSKYLSFFSARWVSRYLGTDVSNYSISQVRVAITSALCVVPEVRPGHYSYEPAQEHQSFEILKELSETL